MNFKAKLLLTSTLALLSANSAQAQTTVPAAAPPAQPQAAEVIVVTGSRIAGNPLNAPQPVQTITAVDLKIQGITNTGDALEAVPALIASNNVEQTARDGVAG